MADQIASALRQCRYFKSLDDAAIAKLALRSRRAAFEKGELVFSKGEPADGVYLLIEGEIALEASSPSGHVVSFAVVHAGAVFGELAALDDAPRTADARARQEATLIKISVRAFKESITENPAFVMAVIRDLINKLRRTDAQIENISFRNLQARLARLLLDLTSNGQASISATQAELADMLSATREKVNGHLQSLQTASAIALRRGAVDIRDRKILEAFAQAD